MRIKILLLITFLSLVTFSCCPLGPITLSSTIYLSFYDGNVLLQEKDVEGRFKFIYTQKQEEKYNIEEYSTERRGKKNNGQYYLDILYFYKSPACAKDSEIEVAEAKFIKNLDLIGVRMEDKLEKYKPVEIYPLKNYIEDATSLPKKANIIVKLEKQ